MITRGGEEPEDGGTEYENERDEVDGELSGSETRALFLGNVGEGIVCG
jgi:hypothetical protein